MVTEEVWMCWAGREPPELVWLTTAYRQSAAQQVRHTQRCSSCQHSPMVGLRYQCLQCLSYDLCQACFFTGQASRGHKPQHPVQEYCYPSTKKEEARAFFTTLGNKLRARQARPKARNKPKRSLKPDRPTDRPTSATSKSSTQSRLSSLLQHVRSSPRVPRGTKTSPASSGFCSGEEQEQSPGDPVYEVLGEQESPGLEWDEGGLELGDWSQEQEIEEDILPSGTLINFENSIFRRDEDTGNMHCYQHNTEKGRKDAMTSIIGHLEQDHAALQVSLHLLLLLTPSPAPAYHLMLLLTPSPCRPVSPAPLTWSSPSLRPRHSLDD